MAQLVTSTPTSRMYVCRATPVHSGSAEPPGYGQSPPIDLCLGRRQLDTCRTAHLVTFVSEGPALLGSHRRSGRGSRWATEHPSEHSAWHAPRNDSSKLQRSVVPSYSLFCCRGLRASTRKAAAETRLVAPHPSAIARYCSKLRDPSRTQANRLHLHKPMPRHRLTAAPHRPHAAIYRQEQPQYLLPLTRV